MRYLFLAVNLLIANTMFVSTSAAATISGTLSLPNGVSASSSGIRYTISLLQNEFGLDAQGQNVTGRATAIIGPNQASGGYSIQLPVSPNFANYQLQFECILGCVNISGGVTTTGYWSDSSGVVGAVSSASSYSSSNSSSVNLTMEPADVFSGTLSFPEGQSALGGEILQLNVRSNSFVPKVFSQKIEMLSSQASADFHIGVPAGETGGGWQLSYTCASCAETVNPEPHYASSSSGNPASFLSSSSYFFLKNNDYPDLNLDLIGIAIRPTSTAISSVLMLLLLDQ